MTEPDRTHTLVASMPVPLWGPDAGTDRINCLNINGCIALLLCIASIIYNIVKFSKGFFLFYFL